jgi:hypothetical protein
VAERHCLSLGYCVPGFVMPGRQRIRLRPRPRPDGAPARLDGSAGLVAVDRDDWARLVVNLEELYRVGEPLRRPGDLRAL